VARMLGWRRICRDIMTPFCGMFYVFDLYMIGRWKRLVVFLSCCILLKLGEKERIKFVGFQHVENPLK